MAIRKILVTGGAGFIGSAVVRHLVDAGYDVVNIDKLTYSGNLDSLRSVTDSAAYGPDGRATVAGTAGYAPDIAGAAGYAPDVALVNHYPHGARLGLHMDRAERSDAPVVSLSLGDTCVFRFGNTETRTRPWTDLELRSGDLFVFGGPARFAYHGVVRTLPGTADPALGLTGRLNITVRQSGLA